MKRKIRWWPALVIVALAATLLAFVWLRDAPDTQARVVDTYKVVFLSLLLLGPAEVRAFVDDDGVATAGDFIWRPEGNRHEAHSPDGCVILGFFLKPNKFLEKA